MEEDILSTTLAYKKSPKTSKRTSFQDELQAAIAARTHKSSTEESYSYADDFEDDDDALEQLLSLRKKKMDMFRAGKKKAVEFRMSEDDQKTAKTKRVSFMKTRTKSSPTPSGSPNLGNIERDDMEIGVNDSRSGSSHSSRSDRSGAKSVQFCLEQNTSRRSRSASPQPLSLGRSAEVQEAAPSTEENWGEMDGARQETVTSSKGIETVTDGHKQEEMAFAEDKKDLSGVEKEPPVPQPRERNVTKTQRSGSPLSEEQPKPRPRQRAPREGSNTEEESVCGGGVSRPPTSSVSIPVSSAERPSSTSSAGEVEASRGHSPQRTEVDCCISSRLSEHSSPGGRLSYTSNRSTDTLDEEGLPEHDKQSSKDKYGSTSIEDNQDADENGLKGGNSGQSHTTEKLFDSSSGGQSKKRPKSAQTQAAESRYMGALKVLDQIEWQIKSQPDMADTVRATVYQEWLKSKQKSVKETMKGKKLEEQLLEEKKEQDEASRKADAKASFAAWNKKKTEVLKANVKGKREVMKNEQREIDDKVEKKEMAKKVFEKWKTGQDECLKEKYRKQKRAERQLRQKKEEEEEERKKDCKTTVLKWSQVKDKDILEQVRSRRRESRIKEEEDKYIKEEKGKMALEMYEKWLKRKERQERRDQHQRKLRAILRDEPPPPWSPPNKTVPFGR